MQTEPEIHPNWVPMAKQFQQTFCRYFPHFEDDIQRAATEMSWLRNGVFINPLDTVRRSKAKKDLRKLVSFVRFVSRWNLPLLNNFVHLGLEAKESDDKVLHYVEGIYDFILMCDEMEHDGLVDAVLRKFIVEAEQGVDRVPETRSINWHAVNAVGRLRTLWWRNTDTYAPSRALNPASLFACYLQDGFDFLKINADPASAFKRWVAVRRHEDVRYEDGD